MTQAFIVGIKDKRKAPLYTGKNWARKFIPLLFKSPDSAKRLFKNMPTFLKIKREFEPKNNTR